ncbi:MAG: hypothetical protein R3185_01975 [Candidatus Thermoplasmatota archaeon]|nr:hypothetical protein [Candidatus Thermoplasmatota archaeon]
MTPPDGPVRIADQFTLELCDKKGAFEVSPDAPLDLDLDEAADQLEAYGFEVITNAGILLVAKAGPIEVSVFESGRLLLKSGDAEMARKATEATYEALGVLA